MIENCIKVRPLETKESEHIEVDASSARRIFDHIDGLFDLWKDRSPSIYFSIDDWLKDNSIDFSRKEFEAFMNFYDPDKYNHIIPRVLLQNIYGRGESEFSIISQGQSNLFNSLKASRKRPIELKIIGDVGPYALCNSQYINVRIKGDCDHSLGSEKELWLRAQGCNITIEGDAQAGLGDYSKDCVFTVYGTVRNFFGRNAKNSTFNIRSITDLVDPILILGQDITLNIVDEKSYELLTKNCENIEYPCKINLVKLIC